MIGIKVVWHALRSEQVSCVCGSDAVFARPGPFAVFSAVLGFVRYACRDCRRIFWLSSDVDHRGHGATAGGPIGPVRRPDPAQVDLAVRQTAPAPTAPGITDLDAIAQQIRTSPPPVPDLSVLDGDLEELRPTAVKARTTSTAR